MASDTITVNATALWKAGGTGLKTLLVAPSAVGALMVLATSAGSNTANTAVSGGGCNASGSGLPGAWQLIAGPISSTTPWKTELWMGVVTTAGSSTITITNTSSGTNRLNCKEFNTAAAANALWSQDGAGGTKTNTTSTTVTFPTLTPSGPNRLYVAFALNGTGQTTGATAGYTVELDPGTNPYIRNPAVAQSAQTPTTVTSSSPSVAVAALIRVDQRYSVTAALAAVAGMGAGAVREQPSATGWGVVAGMGGSAPSVTPAGDAVAMSVTASMGAAPTQTFATAAAFAAVASFSPTVAVRGVPGTMLNIGTADAGKQRYELQTAYPGDGAITTKTVAQIVAGFDDGPGSTATFTSNIDGSAVQFRVRADAPLTSPAAGGPRSELREMELDGTTEKGFDSTLGINWVQSEFRVLAAPDGHLNGIVLMQMHDTVSDVIEVCSQLVSGVIKLVFRINGTSSGLPRLDENFQAGINTASNWAKVRIATGDFGWKIYYQDMTKPFCSSTDVGIPTSPTDLTVLNATQPCYFKVGCYTQQDVSEAIDTTRYSSVEHKTGGLMTYHPGYADPRALVVQTDQVSNVRAGALTVLQNSPAGSMNTTPAFPTGGDAPVDGDLLIMADWVFHAQEGHAQGSVQTPTTPTGWTRKTTNGAYAGPKTGAGASPYHAAIRLSWLYARYQSSGVGGVNTAPTMVVAGAQTDDWHASQIIAVTGALASGDPTDVLGAFNAVDGTPALTQAVSATALGPAAGVTTTLDGSLLLAAFMGEYGITNGTNVPVLAGDALSFVEASDYGGTTGNVMTLAFDYALVTAPQVVADKTPTVAFTTSAKSVGQLWAIRRAITTKAAAAALAVTSSMTAGPTNVGTSAGWGVVAGMAVNAVQTNQVAAALAPQASMTAGAVRTQPSAGAWGVVAGMSAAPNQTFATAAAFSATVALAAGPVQVGTAGSMAAVTGMTAAPTQGFATAAAFSATVALSPGAVREQPAAAIWAPAVSLSALPTLTQDTHAAFAVTAALAADGVDERAEAAAWSATAGMTANATDEQFVAAGLGAVAGASFGAVRDQPATAGWGVVAGFSAAVVDEQFVAAALAPEVSMVANLAGAAQANLAVTASLSASPTVNYGQSAALSVTAGMSAGAVRDQPATITFSAEASLVAGAVREQPASADLTATVAMSATAQQTFATAASLAVEAGMLADLSGSLRAGWGVDAGMVAGATREQFVAADLHATTAMTAAPTQGHVTSAAWGVSTAMSVGPTAVGARATFAATAGLSVHATMIVATAAAFSANVGFTIEAVKQFDEALSMSVQAGMDASAAATLKVAAHLAVTAGMVAGAASGQGASTTWSVQAELGAAVFAVRQVAAALNVAAGFGADGEAEYTDQAVMFAAEVLMTARMTTPRWPMHPGAPIVQLGARSGTPEPVGSLQVGPPSTIPIGFHAEAPGTTHNAVLDPLQPGS